MPTISTFYGIVIRMFFNEHAPPHFHVQYGEFSAEVEIQTLKIRAGHLPKRAKSMVLEWAEEHRDELMQDWDLCQAKQQPSPIAPLE